MDLKQIVKRIVQIGYYGLCQITVPIKYNKAHKNGELQYLSDEDFVIWKKSMLKMLSGHVKAGYASRLNEEIPAFAETKIDILKKDNIFCRNIPIVVLCVKNDRRRIEMLVEHYRKYGVSQFAFLDNGSTDGTLEWMMQQPDIDVFRTLKKYTSFTKEAWISRIVSYYGFDRWFIVTDSDELAVYQSMDEHPFAELIKLMERNGIKRCKGLTLDMYAEGTIFSEDHENMPIREKYCWTDTDSYFDEDKNLGTATIKILSGGPRYRKMNVKTSLSKYPLVYWEKGTVSENAHFQFPYEPAVSAPCYFGILHFKFLDGDKQVFKERSSRNSGFARGGGDYKNYMKIVEENSSESFMYTGSIKIDSYSKLEKIPYIIKPEFEE